jgi:CRP-like cAMP-binding protein
VPQINPASADNRLLAALTNKQRQHFLVGCDSVELAFDEILYVPEECMRYVYFPTESYISLTKPMSDRASLEVGLVGDEGMLGIPFILGVDISPLHAVVQGEGMVLRMKAARFCRELKQSMALQRVLKRYLYVTLDQVAQTAACTRFHVVEARLARWLLMSQDRAHSNAFHVTHEFLACMLGVRRVGVTRAATALQACNLISYSRGDIKILDRSGLEAASCDCYAADRLTYDQAQQEKEKLINEARRDYNKVIPLAEGEKDQRIREADGYRLKRINEAEGDVARFGALLAEYTKAPEVTRRRIYIETLQNVLPDIRSKIIIDVQTHGILPFLNLDSQRGERP